MIIRKPEIKKEGSEILVASKIEFQNPYQDKPNTLWFKFPANNSEFITDRADAFIASLFLLGMAVGEDIEVEGAVSSRLFEGIQQYQSIFASWFPDKFKFIKIDCKNLKPADGKGVKRAVGCFFSGGLDSFYTLWKHLSKNEPDPDKRVSHGLFVHGYDIPLDDEKNFIIAKEAYEKFMERLGLKLLIAKTNVRQFSDKRADPGWDYFHGSQMTGAVLTLGNLISRFYIPASKTYDTLDECGGSDPRIDPLLSTETLEIVHDGAEVNRPQKACVITRWPETYDLLRVCWNAKGNNNCCKCNKCVKTMIPLELAGTLRNYSTFSLALEGKYIRKNLIVISEHERSCARTNIGMAFKRRRFGIILNIYYAILRCWMVLARKKIKKMLIKNQPIL